MKNKSGNKNVVLIILATAMLLNACSSVSFTQRRYNRGIHIEQTRFAFSQHKGKQDVNNPKRVEERRRNHEERMLIPHHMVKEIAVSDLGQLSDLPPTNGSEWLTLQELTIDNHLYLTSSSNDVTTVMENEANMENVSTAERSLQLPAALTHEMEYEERSADADDTDELLTLLIFVLLAIILPPLALYLWEGGVTRNVKISLILVLLVLLGFFAKTLISLYAIAIFHALYVMFVD